MDGPAEARPLREIAGLPVEGYTDYEAEGTGSAEGKRTGVPSPGGDKVIIRPSGTEPEDQGVPVRRQADRGRVKRAAFLWQKPQQSLHKKIKTFFRKPTGYAMIHKLIQ